jgi:hypothetical protein
VLGEVVNDAVGGIAVEPKLAQRAALAADAPATQRRMESTSTATLAVPRRRRFRLGPQLMCPILDARPRAS